MLEYVGSPDDVKQLAILVGEAATGKSADPRLGEALAADFDSRCQTIHHDECPKIEEDDAHVQGKKPSCFTLGVWLCSAEGCRLFDMRNAFLKVMTQTP